MRATRVGNSFSSCRVIHAAADNVCEDARLDVTRADKQKANRKIYRFARVLQLPDTQVLQRNNPDGVFILEETNIRDRFRLRISREVFDISVFSRQTDTHRGVFKVVQTAVCQDEPPPLPGFNSPAFNKQKQTLEETRAQTHDACRRLRFSSIIVSPIFRSQPSLSGLKNVSVRSFPSSSGILNGSLRMLAYSFWKDRRESKLIDQHSSSQITKLSQWKNPKANIFTQKQSR